MPPLPPEVQATSSGGLLGYAPGFSLVLHFDKTQIARRHHNIFNPINGRKVIEFPPQRVAAPQDGAPNCRFRNL